VATWLNQTGTHSFSICSATHEDCLAITTRLRESSFKKALSSLTPDETVNIEGPFGKFVVPSDAPQPIAVLAGGVGITPALSIIKDAARNSWLRGIYLFYSNRSQSEAPFLSDLIRLQAENPDFHLIATMTADEAWQGRGAYRYRNDPQIP
jgi:ferredoxin-NADP reductase